MNKDSDYSHVKSIIKNYCCMSLMIIGECSRIGYQQIKPSITHVEKNKHNTELKESELIDFI